MKKYKSIFFDLDHTLWDFERNSQEALTDIYHDLDLLSRGIPEADHFIGKYRDHNYRCWGQYRRGEITKNELRSLRFSLTLKDFKIVDHALAERIGDEYVDRSPYKTNLFPGAIDILDYLKRDYKIFVITNGFEEIQHIKIKESGMSGYFEKIITSEMAGVRKPDPKIFDLALKTSGHAANEAIMIGDDLETDVLGARQMNIDAILFDPDKKHSPQEEYKIINELNSLRHFL